MKSSGLNIAEIYNNRENLACVKWVAARIQKHGFCQVKEFLQNVSTIDMISVNACIRLLKNGAQVSVGKARSQVKARSFNVGTNEAETDLEAQYPLQAILLAEMLSIGEGSPTIFDDPYRSTMAVALLDIYLNLETAVRYSKGEMKIEYDKLTMDPDFIMTDWNRLVKFNAENEDQREEMMEVQTIIESARDSREFILENLQIEKPSSGRYEEPKVDPNRISNNPSDQMNDFASRLKNLLGGQG